MKTILLFLLLIIQTSYSQAIKPKVMIIPSDAWMEQNKFTSTEDEQGNSQITFNYEKAFREDPILVEAINVTGGLFAERGFEFTDMSQSIKDISSRIERNNITGRILSIKDELALSVSADIILYLDYNISDAGFGQSQVDRFSITAIDAYSNKNLGNAGEPGPRSSETAVASLIRERVLAFINDLESNILRIFEGYLSSGREITIEIIGAPDAIDFGCFDLYSTFVGDKMLYDYFSDWSVDNSINNGGYVDVLEESLIININIPLLDERNRPIQAFNMAIKFMNSELKDIFVMRPERLGLGRAALLINNCK
tara:strand:- start:920 stop:1852 length:933 start_codon:yes stop_codon:yes gene_type:complete